MESFCSSFCASNYLLGLVCVSIYCNSAHCSCSVFFELAASMTWGRTRGVVLLGRQGQAAFVWSVHWAIVRDERHQAVPLPKPLQLNGAKHIHSHEGKCHLVASFVVRLLSRSCGHLDTQKPLNFSSGCTSDESTLRLELFILERLAWCVAAHCAFPPLQSNQILSHT